MRTGGRAGSERRKYAFRQVSDGRRVVGGVGRVVATGACRLMVGGARGRWVRAGAGEWGHERG